MVQQALFNRAHGRLLKIHAIRLSMTSSCGLIRTYIFIRFVLFEPVLPQAALLELYFWTGFSFYVEPPRGTFEGHSTERIV